MNDKSTLFNPFPGLRSFRSDEDHLFFGREEQTLELVSRLQQHRFIAVVGSSGRGKSSLVRCGLLSRLQGGGMAGAGAHWEIAVMHPGGDPLRHLAEALLEAGLYDRAAEDAVPHLLATLGRSQFGLVEAVRQAALPAATNFLLVVDQFEEIFRYDEAGAAESEVANDFIAMLREACAQSGVPIYVVVTMRSDFIGDCSRFDGLAEAVNRGEYLIPRLSREQFKSAIEGPIRVAGGRLAPRLLQRLLNDVGEEQDQLPCLQHALMRTWRVWQGRSGAEALDLEDYAQVGKMSQALSLHADEVYTALATDRQREVCAAMFKALTVEGSEKRGIRRPRRLQTLGRILDVEKTELLRVIDAFRQPEVSFLMPPAEVELRDATVIDLSHESLMRVWTRLRAWVDEEAQSVGIFRRLSESAALWRQGRTALCRDPELSIARAWLHTNRPNAAWAEQYEGSFDEAMAYLQASTEAAEAEIRERQERTRAAAARKARRQHWLIAGLAIAVVGLLIGAFFGIRAQRSSAQQAGRSDMLLGSRFLDEGKLGEGLVYLVGAGRKDPGNGLVAPRLLAALTAHNFSLPVGAPLLLPAPAVNAAFSAEGRWLAAQCADDIVRIIDPREWRVVREIKTDQKIRREGIRWAAKNPNVLAAMLIDGTFVVLDASTGLPLRTPIAIPDKPAGGLANFALSPDGHCAAAGYKGQVFVWNVTTGAITATLPNAGNRFSRISFSADSQRVVTTNRDLVTQMWSVTSGAAVAAAIPPPAGGGFLKTVFTEDGRSLFVWFGEGGQLFDAMTGLPTGPVVKIPVSLIKQVEDFTLSPDGSNAAITRGDGLAVFDVHQGKARWELLPHGSPIFDYSFSVDGNFIISNSVDGLFRIWSMATGRLAAEATFQQEHYAPACLFPDAKRIAVFAPSGHIYQLKIGAGPAAPLVLPRHPAKTLMVQFHRDSAAKFMWVMPTGIKALDLASGRETSGGFAFPEVVSFVSVSTYAGSLMGANQFLVGRTQGTETEPATQHAWTLGADGIAADVTLAVAPWSGANAMNPKGHYFASGNQGANGITVWDVRTGAVVASLVLSAPLRATPVGMCFSPDERHLAYLDLNAVVHVCEIPGGKEAFSLQLAGKTSLSAMRFALDGRHLLTGDDWGAVQLWDAASGKLIQSVQAHRYSIGRFDFSTDGKYYASLSSDGSVQVWDATTNVAVGPPLVQKGAPSRVAFSPDDTRIITPSSSGTARVWDIATGLPLTDLMNHGNESITTVAFSPDGRFVTTQATGDASGMQLQRLWAAPPTAPGTRTPRWLLRLATICAGQQLGDDGKLVSAAEEFARIEELRREIAALSDNDPYAVWAKWFLDELPTRSIAPGFTITPAEADKLARDMAAGAAP